MYSLSVQNEAGKRLELTHNMDYYITSITGLTPADASISTSSMGNFDGEKFNSAHVGKRNIVITIVPRWEIEEKRIALYEYFKPRHAVRLFFENNSRNVYIDGYVEALNGDLFTNTEMLQISILCPNPYFLTAESETSQISRIESLFEFPFSIAKEGIPFSEINDNSNSTVYNFGDIDTGLTIELHAEGGPVVTPVIFNANTNERFSLGNVVMEDTDIITINTNVGQKKITQIANGTERNIISQLSEDVTWFQVPPGSTVFTFSCSSGYEYLKLIFKINEKYQGV